MQKLTESCGTLNDENGNRKFDRQIQEDQGRQERKRVLNSDGRNCGSTLQAQEAKDLPDIKREVTEIRSTSKMSTNNDNFNQNEG
jgi:hypothetical protein